MKKRPPNPPVPLLSAYVPKSTKVCRDPYQGLKAQITEQNFVLGSIDQLHRFGVHSSAYQEAVDTMGDLTTAICLLIIDANMTRNSNPVQNPGGMLRAMTRQHKAGRLNLVGSLIGLDQKQKRKEQQGEL